MNDELDALLRNDLLQPPADFALRVMTNLTLTSLTVQNLSTQNTGGQIQPLPRPLPPPGWTSARPAARPGVGLRLRWLAARAGWVGAGLMGLVLGLDQLAAFVFGLWLAGAAL